MDSTPSGGLPFAVKLGVLRLIRPTCVKSDLCLPTWQGDTRQLPIFVDIRTWTPVTWGGQDVLRCPRPLSLPGRVTTCGLTSYELPATYQPSPGQRVTFPSSASR